MLFLGCIDAKVDAKGRVFLPATFRKVLEEKGAMQVVVRKDIFQDCLVVYPLWVWNTQTDLLRRKLSRWNRMEQQIYRQFVAEAETMTLDSNGRLLISRRLMQQAGIGSDVRFIGMGDTIEMWASGKAEEQMAPQADFAKEIENLMGGGDEPEEA